MTKLGDVILFSAAVLGQGGTNHVNEQMPSYWAKKFLRLGYVGIDCIRPEVWENYKVQVWYRQNTLMYVNSKKFYLYPELQNYHLKNGNRIVYDAIHPEMWVRRLIRFNDADKNVYAHFDEIESQK